MVNVCCPRVGPSGPTRLDLSLPLSFRDTERLWAVHAHDRRHEHPLACPEWMPSPLGHATNSNGTDSSGAS